MVELLILISQIVDFLWLSFWGFFLVFGLIYGMIYRNSYRATLNMPSDEE